MAIDKNSKAYQSLLNKWYSDEQITQMYNSASSWQSRQEVVNNTQPVNTPTTNYQNQWSGSYTFNKDTWYYENTTNTSKNTTNQWMVAKQETATPIKQQETQGSTVGNIQQQGAMKPKSEEYYNQTWDEAQNQIRDNLNRYRQTNPEYFSNYEDFKKNFSYDSRNEEQRNTLDQWYKWYEKGVQLGAVPVNDLYTQYNNWDISQSDLETLRIYNPEKYAELQNQINKWAIIAAYDDDKWLDTTGKTLQDMAYDMAVQTFASLQDSSNWASKYFREYEEKMDSPEMMGLSDKTTELQEEIKNIQDQISTITKDVEKEYEWTWATKSKINAIAADRTYDLQQQLRTLNNEYEKYAMQYNNRMQQYQNEFNMQLQEYQLGVQERNQKMSELWFALDLMNFETNEQKQQREWDYRVKQQEYTNWNINSSDYQTRYKAALKSVQNLLSQYQWIPMKRSAEQMAQDILTAIDNWSNLGAELTKINKQIQEKPEYKQLYNQTFGTGGFGNQVVIWWQEYVEYDWNLYTSEEFNKKFWGNKKSYNVVSEDVISKASHWSWTYWGFMSKPSNVDGAYWGQCGKYANDYLEEIWVWRYYDDALETKLDSVNSWVWKVGTIAVFDYGKESSDWVNHGHVAIVVSQPDKNGNFWVVDSNFNGDEKINTRMVNMKDASLKGFFDPTKPRWAWEWNWTTTTKTTTKTTTSSTWTTTTTSTVSTESDWKIHLGSTKLTPAQFDAYVKKYIDGTVSYSEVKSLWDDALNKVTERALQLAEEWYTPSTKITDPNKQATMEEKLRKEYDKAVSDAQETIDWVNKMEEAYNQIDTNKNAASQAIVIAYNKILDPWSVVREWEYARTAEGQSLLNQIQAKLEKLSKWWAGLTKKELKSLVDVAKKFSENAVKVQKQAADRTKVSIEKYWLTPEAVLPLNVLNQTNTTTQQVEAKERWNKIVYTATPNTWKRRPFASNTTTISVGNWQTITWN